MSTTATCSACSFYDAPVAANACGSTFVAFMTVLQAMFQSRCDLNEACSRAGRDAATLVSMGLQQATYDYIVVGAGPAGSVVATRLSEDSDRSVLLLEAGPEEPTMTEIPAFAMVGLGTVVDWNYTTVAQKNACLSSDGICSWHRGKMVGGSSALNGMMYTRGHYSIYDEWAAAGNDGWSFQEVLQYFKKSERNLNPDAVDDGYHGTSGPMAVQFFPYAPPLTEDVIEAGVALGYRRGDLNGRNQTGINKAQMMVYEGLRDEPSRSYLRALASQRSNLEVAINAHVTKVLIDKYTKTAYGVSYLDADGTEITVLAKREVVLSAGAIGSAQLLLLSGVGPAEHLNSVGVEVVKNLPGVGQNLHNHVSTSVGFTIDDSSTEMLTNITVQEFLTNRNGPLSSTGLTQTTGFFLSKYATDGVPDLQVFFDGYGASCSATGATGECTSGTVDADCGRRYITARPTNVIPLSRGYLQLNSSDPLDYPILQPNYLTVEQDTQVLVEGLKLVVNMTQTAPLQAWNFTINDTPVDGCENFTFASDSYWACVVQTTTGPENHQAGTCKMGPSSDALAVVDERLCVHGVRHLRVVDASIFPKVPNSNPTAAIVMAAEKLSEMIKEDNAGDASDSNFGTGSYGSGGFGIGSGHQGSAHPSHHSNRPWTSHSEPHFLLGASHPAHWDQFGHRFFY